MNIGHNSQTGHVDELTGQMQDIAETLGLGLVFALVEHFGGVELRVPQKLKQDHKLMVLGEVNAQMLCDHYATDTIHVPVTLDRRQMMRKVNALQDRGFKRWEIARELGISQRHVRRLANKEPPPDDNQMDLFGFDDE